METEANKAGTAAFLEMSAEMPVIDVRSPAEHLKGSIPGSINIPLFSNQQRADVGTVYKRRGSTEAILRGLDYVGPAMSDLLKRGIEVAGEDKQLLVHCWRGGMRSESMAWLFSLAGINSFILEGGYKAYRKHILDAIGELKNVIVLGGLTGSGKTSVLKKLVNRGEQALDLEAIANHRGSAFGAIGMPGQPTSEQFANLLYLEIVKLNSSKRVFIEDESLNIGAVFLPENLYSIIRSSPVIALMCDADNRLPRLEEEYGKMPAEMLKDSIGRISKRLGGQNAENAIQYIDNGKTGDAIKLVLAYYDKAYRFGLSKREKESVHILNVDSRDGDAVADLVIKTANSLLG